jgi:AcrR family transcriptional regulator
MNGRMTASRRVGSTTSETRAQILQATEQILVERGYAAVTSRNVATAVGIKPGLVHYYFPTLDDLFIAVFRRGAEQNMERMAITLASPEPLRALWEQSSDRRGVALLAELLAAANHRTALKAEMVDLAQRARRLQIEAIRKLLPQYDLDPDRFPPELVAAAIQGIALLLVREEVLKLDTGHDKAAASFTRLLDELEERRQIRG